PLQRRPGDGRGRRPPVRRVQPGLPGRIHRRCHRADQRRRGRPATVRTGNLGEHASPLAARAVDATAEDPHGRRHDPRGRGEHRVRSLPGNVREEPELMAVADTILALDGATGANGETLNLLAYWPAQEGEGASLADASGNGRTGT